MKYHTLQRVRDGNCKVNFYLLSMSIDFSHKFYVINYKFDIKN